MQGQRLAHAFCVELSLHLHQVLFLFFLNLFLKHKEAVSFKKGGFLAA